MRHVIGQQHRRRHHFMAELGASTVEMDDIRGNTEVPKLRSLLCFCENFDYQTRAKDSSVFMKTILNRINSLILEIFNLEFLGKGIKTDEVAHVTIESLAKVRFQKLNFDGAWHDFSLEVGWCFDDPA
jgi:hypothetical protein